LVLVIIFIIPSGTHDVILIRSYRLFPFPPVTAPLMSLLELGSNNGDYVGVFVSSVDKDGNHDDGPCKGKYGGDVEKDEADIKSENKFTGNPKRKMMNC
jgi:hypothetical protein